MSLDATRWAWEQKVKGTHKLVLLSLADRADERHACYPSVERLTADTGLNRKTVMDAISELEESGLISVDRLTGSGNRYRLMGVSDRHQGSTKNGTGAENGTGPKSGTEPVPKTVLAPVPKTGHESTNESTKNLSVTKTKRAKREKSRTQLPADFALNQERVTAAVSYWMRKNRDDLARDLQDQFSQFQAHHRAKGTTMADWDAAWQTWYCNAVKFNKPQQEARYASSQRPNRQPVGERLRNQAAAVIANIEDREARGFALGEDG